MRSGGVTEEVVHTGVAEESPTSAEKETWERG